MSGTDERKSQALTEDDASMNVKTDETTDETPDETTDESTDESTDARPDPLEVSVKDSLDDMLDEEHLNPPGPSRVDEPPDYIESNDPEDALAKTDPEKPVLDHQDVDAGTSEIKHPENPDTKSPDDWGRNDYPFPQHDK